MIFLILFLVVFFIIVTSVSSEYAIPVCFLVGIVLATVFVVTSAFMTSEVEQISDNTIEIIDIYEVYSEKGKLRVCYTDEEYKYHDKQISGTVKLYDNEDKTDPCDYYVKKRVKWKNRAWYWLGYPMNDVEEIYIRSQIE